MILRRSCGGVREGAHDDREWVVLLWLVPQVRLESLSHDLSLRATASSR